MHPVTRRWCLLAIAAAPIALGLTAQALYLRLDDGFLRVNAPNLEFLTGKPLERLMDGKTVGYLGQLTVLSGYDRTVQSRSVAHFAFSYDIWTERFKVTLISPGLTAHPSQKNLTRNAAQAWCLDRLRIDMARLPSNGPLFVRLEIRSEDPKETEGIVGEPGISLSRLIELFSHPVKNQQVYVSEEIKVEDLRKPRS